MIALNFMFAGGAEIGYDLEQIGIDEHAPADCVIVGVDANQNVLHAKLKGPEFAKTLCGEVPHGKPTSLSIRRHYGCEDYRWCHKCAKLLMEHNHVLLAWENRRKRPRKATCEQQSLPTG